MQPITIILRKNKMWGNHFWQRGYFVDSVGINEELIRRYVRHQEKMERQEQAELALDQKKGPFQGLNTKPPSSEGGFFTTGTEKFPGLKVGDQ